MRWISWLGSIWLSIVLNGFLCVHWFARGDYVFGTFHFILTFVCMAVDVWDRVAKRTLALYQRRLVSELIELSIVANQWLLSVTRATRH